MSFSLSMLNTIFSFIFLDFILLLFCTLPHKLSLFSVCLFLFVKHLLSSILYYFLSISCSYSCCLSLAPPPKSIFHGLCVTHSFYGPFSHDTSYEWTFHSLSSFALFCFLCLSQSLLSLSLFSNNFSA